MVCRVCDSNTPVLLSRIRCVEYVTAEVHGWAQLMCQNGHMPKGNKAMLVALVVALPLPITRSDGATTCHQN
jgi:hypothetical protein